MAKARTDDTAHAGHTGGGDNVFHLGITNTMGASIGATTELVFGTVEPGLRIRPPSAGTGPQDALEAIGGSGLSQVVPTAGGNGVVGRGGEGTHATNTTAGYGGERRPDRRNR
jgi:hypothetical protein